MALLEPAALLSYLISGLRGLFAVSGLKGTGFDHVAIYILRAEMGRDRYLLDSGSPYRLWFSAFSTSGWRIFLKGRGSIITAC
jgi:hypothetical protein